MSKIPLSTRLSFLILLVSIAIMVSGCGGRPSRVKVSGKVTIEGKPLSVGGISFKPVEGGRKAGSSFDSEGKYTTTMYEPNDGLPLGSYTVAINSSRQVNDNTKRWHAPKKYSDHETSGLTAEITEETSSLNYDLTWEGDEHSKPWNQKLK